MNTNSSNNFIPALVSFFIPGLGQLIQGRILAAFLYFVISVALWFFFLGWLGHIVACIDAARWKPR
jgi:TM2 domain-containing membrane protein YozV